MRKSFAILAAVLALIIAIPLVVIGPEKLAEQGRIHAAEPARTVEDVRTQWGGNKPKAAAQPVGTVQERARWACSNAVERIAVNPGSIRWTRRSQWVSVEREPGVWEVHAHFMARNAYGADVTATHACVLKLAGNEFILIKG